jgi:hypothetical protein
MNLWLLMSSFESDLVALESFREWLHELVEAQQPLAEWSMPLSQLSIRYPSAESKRLAQPSPRLFF